LLRNFGDTILNSAAVSLAEYIQCLGGPALKSRRLGYSNRAIGGRLKIHYSTIGKLTSGTANCENRFFKSDRIHPLMISGCKQRNLMVSHRNILLNQINTQKRRLTCTKKRWSTKPL